MAALRVPGAVASKSLLTAVPSAPNRARPVLTTDEGNRTVAGKAPRNKTTRSRPARPTQKRYPETRMERGVLIIVGAVLAIATVVVLSGLYVTQYRPPRAHALTVDGQDYNADAVKRRGSYMLRYEPQASRGVTQETLVDATVDRIVRDEVLLRRAPALVGDVTDADIDQGLRLQLGFATPTATPAPSPSPGATPSATSSPVATPTEVITPDAEQRKREEADFARAQQDLYQSVGVKKSEFLRILRARLLEDRLKARFAADVGKTAPQVKLQVIRLTDEALAQRLRDQAVQGADFVRLAAQNSVISTARQDGGDLGWKLVATLGDPIRTAVESLPQNGISAIVRNDRFFEIYKVTEATTSRDLDATQQATLVDEKLTTWFAEETPNVPVERDISDGEREWILDAIVEDVTDRGPVTTPTPTAAPRG